MSRQLIVVGVDATPASRSALVWAAAHARTTGCRLLAVQVLPEEVSDLTFTALPTENQQAHDTAYRVVDEAYRALPPEPDWRLVRTFGRPGRELVRYAKRADLLVLGSDEHTGFRGVLHNSTLHYCLRHSRVPVLAYP